MTVWSLSSPCFVLSEGQALELSAAVGLGHHCGLDREQGGASCPQAALELALDKKLRSAMWSKLHMCSWQNTHQN